jgi:hypothetical protein
MWSLGARTDRPSSFPKSASLCHVHEWTLYQSDLCTYLDFQGARGAKLKRRRLQPLRQTKKFGVTNIPDAVSTSGPFVSTTLFCVRWALCAEIIADAAELKQSREIPD